MAVSLVAAGFAVSVPAHAQTQNPGWYAGGSLGQMEAEGDCPGGWSCDRNDTSFKIFGGYRINRNFAAEAFYADWGKIKVSRGVVNATGELSSLGLAALGILPVGQQFELFGKLGLARTEQKATGSAPGVSLTNRDTGSELILGVGGAFNFTRNLALRAEWERLNDSEANVLSLGLQYKF
jgi:OOP family OmpA-OmpF porin